MCHPCYDIPVQQQFILPHAVNCAAIQTIQPILAYTCIYLSLQEIYVCICLVDACCNSCLACMGVFTLVCNVALACCGCIYTRVTISMSAVDICICLCLCICIYI